MYTPDTVLVLKQQRDPDPETNEEFPYNRVKVIGPSPVDHGGARGGEWEGTAAQGVVIVPLSNFGSTLDEPYGKLGALYDVESVPDTTIEVKQTIRVIDSSSQSAGPTPEEVFAVEAPGEPPKEGEIRGRTPFESPLEDPRVPANASPLDIHPEQSVQDGVRSEVDVSVSE